MYDFRLWTRIAEAIRSHPLTPRVELAQIVGISPATVTRVVQDMVECRVLLEVPGSPLRASGRPVVGLAVNPEVAYALVLDIKVQSAGAAVVDFSGTVVHRRELEMPMEDVAAALRVLPGFLAETLAELPEVQRRVWGLGISIPGAWSMTQHALVYSASLPRWQGVNLEQYFRELADGTLRVENDARAAALAELALGAARRLQDFLYVYGAYGVGSCFVHGRELIRGHDNLASGLGHSLLGLDGPVCEDCGRSGCIGPHLNAGVIRRRVAAGEAEDAVLQDTSRILAIPVANLLNMFCPEALLIGGHLFRAWPALHPLLVEATQARLLTHIVHRVAFVPAEVGEDAVPVGMAMRVFAAPPRGILARDLTELAR